MLPLISFETGRSTQIQSSGQLEKAAPANGSLVLSEYRNHGREANTRGEESKRIYTRAPPKRVGRAFALLTKTYHGSRITGHLATSTHLSGLRVNQDLDCPVACCSAALFSGSPQ